MPIWQTITTHSEPGLAQDTINQLYSISSIEALNSFQQKSYIHRLQGILDTENGNYSAAKEHLLKSIEYVNNDPGEAYYGPSYIAISEVALANLFYHTGEYGKCREHHGKNVVSYSKSGETVLYKL